MFIPQTPTVPTQHRNLHRAGKQLMFVHVNHFSNSVFFIILTVEDVFIAVCLDHLAQANRAPV